MHNNCTTERFILTLCIRICILLKPHTDKIKLPFSLLATAFSTCINSANNFPYYYI